MVASAPARQAAARSVMASNPRRVSIRQTIYFPLLLILVGLIHGLLYVFIIPPWQHYDEPTQFEYAWLLANRRGVPAPGDYDQGMRREVAASMIEHRFFTRIDIFPNLMSQEEPIWIGIPQTGDFPLYYWLISLPLKLFKGTDITLQLYLGRLISTILYLVSILAAYGIAAELFTAGHPMRWLLPLSIALIPGFTDLMTAVNNDVGATAFFSLFLWSGVVLLKRGFRWPILIACVGLASICFWTKSTVTIAVLIVIIPVLFSILPGAYRSLGWLSIGLVSLIGILMAIVWSDAIFWYRKESQETPIRSYQANAPHGSYILELIQMPNERPVRVFQPIALERNLNLGGSTVTLGAWIWASEPTILSTPGISDGSQMYTQKVQVTTSPAFYAFPITLSVNVERLDFILAPEIMASDKPVSVYYDGMILVEGMFPQELTPQFADPDGKSGAWANQPFTNLVRNASVEKGWIRLRPGVEKILKSYFPVFSPAILASLADWPGSGWYYKMTAQQLLQTFWGKFGWAHVPIIGQHTYTLLMIVSIAGLLGALIWLIRGWRNQSKEILLLLIFSFLLIWEVAFIRGVGSLGETLFIPSARYAFPAIIPTVLFLTIGWGEILRPLEGWKTFGRIVQIGLYLLFLLGLDILSVWSIVHYYA